MYVFCLLISPKFKTQRVLPGAKVNPLLVVALYSHEAVELHRLKGAIKLF